MLRRRARTRRRLGRVLSTAQRSSARVERLRPSASRSRPSPCRLSASFVPSPREGMQRWASPSRRGCWIAAPSRTRSRPRWLARRCVFAQLVDAGRRWCKESCLPAVCETIGRLLDTRAVEPEEKVGGGMPGVYHAAAPPAPHPRTAPRPNAAAAGAASRWCASSSSGWAARLFSRCSHRSSSCLAASPPARGAAAVVCCLVPRCSASRSAVPANCRPRKPSSLQLHSAARPGAEHATRWWEEGGRDGVIQANQVTMRAANFRNCTYYRTVLLHCTVLYCVPCPTLVRIYIAGSDLPLRKSLQSGD